MFADNAFSHGAPAVAVGRLVPTGILSRFFSAVRIHHTIAGFPRDLQFKPLQLKPRDVLEQLRPLGYPVA